MAKPGRVAEVAVRRYWREAEARVMVEAWRTSGESLAGFARRHGVDPRRVARWAGRVAGSVPAPVRFHPVRLADRDGGGGAAIEIHLVGGPRVRVPAGFQAEDLRRVVAVLEPGRPC
jgi:transposase